MMSLRLSFSISLFLIAAAEAAALSGALPRCPDRCGNVSVPYPFGIGQGCYLPGFRMTCNDEYDPPTMFIDTGNILVTEITDDSLTVDTFVAWDCLKPLDITGTPYNKRTMFINVTDTPYTLSYERNRFTVLGCDTIVLFYSINPTFYGSGCLSFCSDTSNINNGSCAGIGCCQTVIPRGLKLLNTSLWTLTNHTSSFAVSNCSFAFLVDQKGYNFDVTDLPDFNRRNTVPTVLDWAIGNRTCEEVKGATDYACGPNSQCLNSTNGPGYRCRCNSGYQGNPYLLPGGCQDVNECADTSPCAEICTNTPGSYVCSCSGGKAGDGMKSGTGCIRQSKKFPLVLVVLGVGLGSVFLIAIASWSYWALKKRRTIVLREKFFKQNGGLLLQQRLASRDGGTAETARIFTARELEEATEGYSESRVLGRGGYGTVYKGILQQPDQRVVAIKKSKLVEVGGQVEQFINEVVVLSQVIHRNVVRILGCCLETPVPLLVYEYIPNGDLTHHLHDDGHVSSLSWYTRLRIAAETAGALAYMHFAAAARPIIHRDVKTANILLDDAYTAKVSDFGASRLVPLDKAHITTLVQGTDLGYLDPEYFQTGQLTEKSDVYSFGVVLAELLTGQRPLSQARPQQERTLAMYFLLAMKDGRAFQVLEQRVRNEGSREQLEGVMEVAKGCLRLKGEERPTMKEVAAELERLRRASAAGAHPWAAPEGGGDTDTEYHSLVNQQGGVSAFYTSASNGDDRIEEQILMSLDMQR